MRLYSDLELNDDIEKIKHIFYKYSTLYKNIGNIILNTNNKLMPRINFIKSQFKTILYKDFFE